MRYVGGQAKSKLAGGKTRKYYYDDKWGFNGVFACQKSYYKPPFSQDQNCFKTNNKKHRFLPKKTTASTATNLLCAPDAPRNTTSYIIRAKNCGGIAASPSSTPASLTPPYRECIVEQANQEWGVDSYGSMKGLLRVRHRNDENDYHYEPDLGKCVQVLEEKLEQRLDQDIGLFELAYPSNGECAPQILEVRIKDQDNQIAHLQEESTSLKERVICMEQELHNLKLRMQLLEGANALRLRDLCSAVGTRIWNYLPKDYGLRLACESLTAWYTWYIVITCEKIQKFRSQIQGQILGLSVVDLYSSVSEG